MYEWNNEKILIEASLWNCHFIINLYAPFYELFCREMIHLPISSHCIGLFLISADWMYQKEILFYRHHLGSCTKKNSKEYIHLNGFLPGSPIWKSLCTDNLLIIRGILFYLLFFHCLDLELILLWPLFSCIRVQLWQDSFIIIECQDEENLLLKVD